VQKSLPTFRQVDKHFDVFTNNVNETVRLFDQLQKTLDHIGIRKVHAGTMSACSRIPGLAYSALADPPLDELQEAENKKDAEIRARELKKLPAKPEPWEKEPDKYVKPVPPTWVHQSGKSPAAKNPGRVKLAVKSELKSDLEKKHAKILKPRPALTGVRQEFDLAWRTLGIPFTEDDRYLDTGDPSLDGPQSPSHMNAMPGNMHGGAVARPQNKPKAPGASRQPVDDVNKASALELLGLTATRGGFTYDPPG